MTIFLYSSQEYSANICHSIHINIDRKDMIHKKRLP